MAKQISRKIRIFSYALMVLFLGAATGWIGGPASSSIKRVEADVPGDGPGGIGDGPASGCPSPSDCCN